MEALALQIMVLSSRATKCETGPPIISSKKGCESASKERKETGFKSSKSVLWDYRTTTRTPTEEPPFSLVYNTDALLPIEADLPSIQTLNYNTENNIQGLHVKMDLIEELCEDARLRMTAFK